MTLFEAIAWGCIGQKVIPLAYGRSSRLPSMNLAPSCASFGVEPQLEGAAQTRGTLGVHGSTQEEGVPSGRAGTSALCHFSPGGTSRTLTHSIPLGIRRLEVSKP